MRDPITVRQKYAQPGVVDFWKGLSQTGLQKCEDEMVERYFPRQMHLLDVGCGAGRAALSLSRAGYDVTGIDLSQNMLAAGRSLSREAKLVGADLLRLPFVDHGFDGVFMFFGALQHVPNRDDRRSALREMARVTHPTGRLILGLDNVAPALACHGYWLTEKIRRMRSSPTGTARRPQAPSPTDSTLWSRETRGVHPLVWHARGLARSLRWRSWPALLDSLGYVGLRGREPGHIRIAQVALPSTPGRIDYHLYRADELIADATPAGWRLVDYHSGTELSENRVCPPSIRRRDKQLFFAFERESLPRDVGPLDETTVEREGEP